DTVRGSARVASPPTNAQSRPADPTTAATTDDLPMTRPPKFGPRSRAGYGARVTSRQKRKYADLSKPRTSWDMRVELPENAMRLDRFLTKRVDWKSRNELQTLIDEGRITVNGAVRKASTKLQTLDTVVIQLDAKEAPDYAAVPIDVLYEDE